jgi:hypothetical protein
MRISPRVPLIILTALVAMASAAQTTECLTSASAVWVAHPGSHATWRLRLPWHIGEKCWFARGSTTLRVPHVRQAWAAKSWSLPVYGEADQRTAGQAIRAIEVAAIDGPDKSPATHVSQDGHDRARATVDSGMGRQADAHRFLVGGRICGAGPRLRAGEDEPDLKNWGNLPGV